MNELFWQIFWHPSNHSPTQFMPSKPIFTHPKDGWVAKGLVWSF